MTPRPLLGAGLTLASALLFGLSTPAAKVLLGELHPVQLAGLLYAGAGIGLLIMDGALRAAGAPRTAPRIHGAQWRWLAASVLFGGIVGPLLLLWGLQRTAASAASLLLNLEAVLTALIAWLIFREAVTLRLIGGIGAMLAGAVLVSWQGRPSLDNLVGPLAVVGACCAWGLDNNIMRRIASADPIQIASVRSVVAGSVNLGVALLLGIAWPGLAPLFAGAAVGFLGFGLSLVLFVVALRHLGAARTAAFFAAGPFAGAIASVLVLREPLTATLLAAGVLMAAGAWATLAAQPAR